ncbi:TolC family protein [Nitratifractor salsuginis]|uniref:Outer membrane efflux protein n=1 Tax=Nitratifractor salsuginis (strain DSM 16511 / JCM 12458 / E9I37-1) TaxID=749222 RepID=E6WZU6_NITSE|nr:TolC family protein [Nitratifractor salsuginis]ADV45604.1 outer membrane efflux protein [Nitratifractor salsuginis DSM 16511]
MWRAISVLLIGSIPALAGLKHLTLNQALQILDKKNMEIKVSKFEETMKKYDELVVEGKNWGSLTVSLQALRSNDAGNVFGFKLQSREADFEDFGFSDFLACMGANPPAYCQDVLHRQPEDLNYPKARNHFLTKLTYQVPLYTGGKLTEYKKITEKMYQMSKLDTRKLRDEKIFQVKKAFYNITLVNRYIYNLNKIRHNMEKLKRTIWEMKKEGYTKKTDVLEVEARLAKVDSMLNQARLNRSLALQFLSFLIDTDVDSIRQVNLSVHAPRVSKSDIERMSLDIQKAKMGLEVARHAIQTEKANFLPMVGAFGEYGSADDHLWNDFGKKDFYTVGMQVKMNLFNGGSDKAKLEKARVRHMKVATQVALAKKGIALQVKKLQTSIRSLEYDLKSERKQLELAKQVYKTYETKYKEGLASITDVLIKQSIELQVLLEYLQVANKHSEKVFELEKILDWGGRS